MTEIWAVAHQAHPMTVEDEPCLCWTDFTCLAREHDTPDRPSAKEQP